MAEYTMVKPPRRALAVWRIRALLLTFFPGFLCSLIFLLSLPGLAHCHRHLDRRFPLFLLLLVPYQMEKAQLLPDKFYPIYK